MGLIGGAVKSMKGMDNKTAIYMMFAVLSLLLIKIVVVKITYNNIVPKIMKKDDVYKLTYTDSLFLVVLASSLFS
jgi:hypothetical protein